ncbi:MAG: bifunctional phosphopantothenoylcysteine decarboxylase/phosphopantothenate--cysteine ligase CoaBC [Ornithinimicrobium sp.]|uniref:bifunctional phosphopantothenoylcysteine decarboxylase/phosphopantothenate--cysteine ligase CoaBC n=1 Tax=Ornithinimicrobium sp. TaxID=1977084 RepID=UPI0026E0BBB7|nr:bifunctional phosphopantothenoylcysteine decarboxylase/phosphopantothenate--cysteine ligase CoaBC [Ornithinimicrobium sp.]MDO5739496.1 bifunctional phosphopantothenoylcysteine decarboxylase/phosphopantothenate--cysteine ligase CoaBC [Ornithinimicrobium sp.]
MRVVLGVAGGIAAYKAALVLRLLTEAGHQVTVVPTEAALHFVGVATWEALSGAPVSTQVWDDIPSVRHVRLGQEADLVLVAPATADLMARAAHGLADDLLTTTLLATHAPVVLAPAMHTEMWLHPATVANVALLRERGVTVIEPACGRLTGTDSGPGRLPEPEAIVHEALTVAAGAAARGPVDASGPQPDHLDLAGRHVVVSAGGTREPLDPVRFLGNRSSGKQGYAVAQEAARRGARVTLICANVALPVPAGCDVVPVESALDLHREMNAIVARGGVDVIVMTAAVADFRPAHYAEQKIKKTHGEGDESAPVVELVRNPDILAGLVQDRGVAGTPYIVGFAAETGDETGDVLSHARAKLTRKGCDLLVANKVGISQTFGQDTSTVHLLWPYSEETRTIGPTDKSRIAIAIWDAVVADLP